jgi:phytanoyl-CoA hydroxylase
MNQACATANDAITASYNENGYYVASKIFSDEECEAMKVEAMRVLREKANPKSTVYVGVAAASPMYYRLASDPRLVAVLDRIMPDGVAFMSDKFVFKSGAQRFATPWHIDKFYWRNTRAKLSVWIALDKCSAENGALKVIRGSHKKTWTPKNADTSQTNNEFSNVIDGAQWAPEEEVVCEVEKGSAIFFSDALVHGSCTNTAGLDRYAIISTYHAPVSVEEPFDKPFPARHVIVRR